MVSHDASRPNLLVIMSDDQGPWALGCAGNDEIITPNLDELATRGVRFSRFFCASPVCSPARASLLTGLMPSQHGVHDFIRLGNMPPDAVTYLDGLETYSQLLADQGYAGGMSGKWHLGNSVTPQAGFNHWYAHQAGSSRYFDPPMVRDGKPIDDAGYATDLITEDAIAFIGSTMDSDSPFHASVHYTAPHNPWVGQHPEQFVNLYANCAFKSCPQEPHHPWGPTSFHPSMQQAIREPRESLMGYFAAVTAMDHGIGRILQALDEWGIRESTFVLFLSDNGFNCGHHGIWGKGNGTFPQNMYDSSVMVPAIFSQPGTIPEATTVSALTSAYDIFPTIAARFGLEPTGEDERVRPGQDLGGLLTGNSSGERDHVVVYDEYGPVRMIRTDEWKYVHRYAYGPHELYCVAEDPRETENRVDEPGLSSLVGDLRATMQDWFDRHSCPDRDGSRLPVAGIGQDSHVTDQVAGATAFRVPRSRDLPTVDIREACDWASST